MTYLICCQAVWLLTGCSTEDLPQGPVAADFVMSATKSTSPGATRMVSSYTDGSADDIAVLCAIPFEISTDYIGLDDVYKQTPLNSNFELTHQTPEAIFRNGSCAFNTGVNSVLAYARSKPSALAKAATGCLVATMSSFNPGDIRFDLQPIIREENPFVATDLLAIMNAVADEWSKCSDAELQRQYDIFRNKDEFGVFNILPGSSANIKEWVKKFLNVVPSDGAIKSKMDDLIKDLTTGFPASIGLPDGAAVIRWNGEAFAYETETTTMGNINGVERFAYPAELYYYGNSKLMVSDNDVSSVFDNSDSKNWTELLNENFSDGAVQSSTKTIAMKDPLQYGVARLQIKLKADGGSLNDKNNTAVSIGTSSNPSFPLTGIIVSGQLPVGFDFTPASLMSVYSETDMKFIYDSQVKNEYNHIRTDGFETTPFITNTLVLQSYDNKKLLVALEFQNDSNTDFEGATGIVYKGTKFYLIGEIEPKSDADKPKASNRVFTQDHTTTVQFTVKSLEKAYNVLPDLMSPRLEMGLELTPKWVQTTPTDVELNP